MKLILKHFAWLIAIMVFAFNTAIAQSTNETNINQTKNTATMKTYLIEREIPGASKLTAEQLKGISITSCSVLKEMGSTIEWQHSYVAGNKIYCVYKAESEELIREHAKKGGFPANVVTEVSNIISPATAQ